MSSNEAIFDQIEFIRSQTLKMVQGLTEEEVRTIPDGFRNHILWNLGHIAFVQDRFAFLLAGLPSGLPEQYREWFANGTSPLEWTGQEPDFAEVCRIAGEQPSEIRRLLSGRLDEPTVQPFTTSSGFTMDRIGSLLSFSLYHEGMHFGIIKQFKKTIQG
ncbi:DinB family protein [Paenibacillus sp. 79R4]|uniref:DinB family protein n=1 Tax=Paenibacillus sp. 79R4 TaxID=2212847 RepID=UPI0015B7C272|nr:DinB family protein [Paenibacillus sp. 79R4]